MIYILHSQRAPTWMSVSKVKHYMDSAHLQDSTFFLYGMLLEWSIFPIFATYVFASGTEGHWGSIGSKVVLHRHGNRNDLHPVLSPHTSWVKVPVCSKSRLSSWNDSMGEQVLVCKCHGALSWWKENSDWSVSTSVLDTLYLIYLPLSSCGYKFWFCQMWYGAKGLVGKQWFDSQGFFFNPMIARVKIRKTGSIPSWVFLCVCACVCVCLSVSQSEWEKERDNSDGHTKWHNLQNFVWNYMELGNEQEDFWMERWVRIVYKGNGRVMADSWGCATKFFFSCSYDHHVSPPWIICWFHFSVLTGGK